MKGGVVDMLASRIQKDLAQLYGFREEMARTGSEPMEKPISDVLGPGAEKRFTGYYRDPANLNEFKPADFEGGTIVPVYRLLPDGQYRLHTMFANPAPGRHP
ncbi:hypothetical protein [Streptomyces sp. NPDC002559]